MHMKKVAVALVFICFGIGMLSAEGEKNFIKVGGALEMRENSAGIDISTSAAGYTGSSEIAGLELGEGDHHVSMSLKGMDVREIIRIIGRTAKCNAVACRSVTGKIEQVKITDVEWPVVLASLADSMGYQTRLQDGIVFVGTPADFALLTASDSGGPDSEENISMDFKDTEISQVLKVIINKRKTGSIVIPANVSGKCSVSLQDVPERVAMRAVARSHGFDCLFYSGVWFVASPEVINSLRQRDLDGSGINGFNDPEKVTIDFRNTEITQILKVLGNQCGKKFEAADNVHGRITALIIQQSYIRALAYIAWCNGYEIAPTADGLQIR